MTDHPWTGIAEGYHLAHEFGDVMADRSDEGRADALKAAWRAVDACGGAYSREEHANGYSAAHAAALGAAQEALEQLGAQPS